MPLLAFRSQPVPGFGQKNGSVRLGVYVTGLSQAREGSIDGHMRDTEPARQIHHACFPQSRRQISNGLDIILHDFHGPVAARAAKAFGLLCRQTQLGGMRGGDPYPVGMGHGSKSEAQPGLGV